MRAVILVFGALLASCAMSPPTRSEAAAPDELSPALRELEARKADLARHRGAGDCDEVCRLSGLVCTAAERVCVITARHEGEAAYEGHCTRAKKDCAEAREECGACR